MITEQTVYLTLFIYTSLLATGLAFIAIRFCREDKKQKK